MRALAVAAPAALLCACATKPAAPLPPPPPGAIAQHDRETYYDLTGSSADGLHAQMRSWGSAHGDPEMAAQTAADFNTSFKARQEPGGCQIMDVTLELKIETTLPRWRDAVRADADLASRWHNFDVAIRKHERGHYDYALGEARELLAALQGIQVARCEEANSTAQKINDRIAKKYQSINDEYDRKTGHGRTQGAVL